MQTYIIETLNKAHFVTSTSNLAMWHKVVTYILLVGIKCQNTIFLIAG